MIRLADVRCGLAGTFAAAALLGGACGPPVPPPDQVAELGGRALSYQAFETFLELNAVDGAGGLGSDVLSSLLDQFLDEQILARLATDRLGIEAGVDSRSAADALLDAEDQAPTEEEIADHYRLDRDRFTRPERIHLRQLLFADRRSAERIRELWIQGESYDTVVGEVVANPTAHVGEEGAFARSSLPPVFAETLFGLHEGEISEVMRADYGFHVFQVVEHLVAGMVPLEEVREAVFEELMIHNRQEALARLVAEARQRYNVRVFERNLPFNYRGRYGSNTTHEDH